MATTKADLILHPIRLRLVTELAGHRMTPRQLAQLMPDVPQATLYRQIRMLLDGGIFEVVAEQVVNGAVERTYAVVRNSARLTNEEMSTLTAEEHLRYFTIFTTTLIGTFARSLQGADLPTLLEQGMSYNSTTIYLTDEEREHFRAALMQLMEDIMSRPSTPDRKGYTLASFVIPKGDQTE